MKKLQIALDLFDEKTVFSVLEEVGQYVDIIELGTPLCLSVGTGIARKVKEKYPDKIVFSDVKIMDGGGIISKVAFDNGADMISVLAVAADSTVKAAIQCARDMGKKVLVDMCNVPDMEGRGKEIEAMQPDYICCHVGYDVQQSGVDPIEELRRLDKVNIPKAIAGGIHMGTFAQAANSPADVIIVGGGLYNQPNMGELARQMRGILDDINNG